MTASSKKTKSWIGLAEVVPKPGYKYLLRGKGAFVIVLALAKSVRSFDRIVCKILNATGFHVPEISEIQPFKVRSSHSKMGKRILVLEKKLSKTNPVVFDAFHSYKK